MIQHALHQQGYCSCNVITTAQLKYAPIFEFVNLTYPLIPSYYSSHLEI